MARISMALALVAMIAFAGVAHAQQGRPDIATIQIQFDNRGSKVEGQAPKLTAALAKMFKVGPKQVAFSGVTGQSGLFNHQSVATFTAMGPATNGKSVYQNCVDSVKKGWFSGSQVEKDLKKASDSWWPGDSVKVEKATCGGPGLKPVSGR